jgi:hypothetical protein
MKFLRFIAFFSFICLASTLSLAADEKSNDAAKVNWKDITEKVYTNPADQQGWIEDSKAKVYRDEKGDQLKVTCDQFGELRMDLISQKVFLVKADGTQAEIQNAKLFQRDNGLTIVLRSEKYKVRVKMTEKVPGMEKIQGIKAQE